MRRSLLFVRFDFDWVVCEKDSFFVFVHNFISKIKKFRFEIIYFFRFTLFLFNSTDMNKHQCLVLKINDQDSQQDQFSFQFEEKTKVEM